ncbi:DUF4823 domain-containing protein [Stutzerimonas tarimensis]|uniref:DUF4823 domain-containing protein n=1 Tax=Stutzerimonas tarimensis TaxID=1507735 RepID=A0ABV7TCE4_9GAMM
MRVIFRGLGLGLWVCLLGGCMKVSDMAEVSRQHLRDVGLLDHSVAQRSSGWRLQADSAIFIAQGHFVPAGEAYPRPNVVADSAFTGFVEYFPRVRRAAQPLGLEEALEQGRHAGSHYILYSRFASADDRIGTYEEWNEQRAANRLGVDSGVVQLMLIEIGTGYLVDTARIRVRGGLLSIYDTRPEDLLLRPFQQYAQRLLGLSG